MVNSDVLAGIGANDLTVRNTTLDHSDVAIGSMVEGALVTGVSGDSGSVYVTQSTNVTVRDNDLETVHLSDVDRVTIADNGPDDSGRFGVRIASMGAGNVTIANNVLTGNTANSTPSAGVRVQSVHNLTVADNTIAGNENGIVVLEITDREERPETEDGCAYEQTRTVNGSVEVYGNSLANNTHGIVNDDSAIVNAVNNYWGDADGPSSATSQPLQDPQTGELADGDGATVSEHPDESGVSNVRFDPWLDDQPQNQSTGTESAAN